MQVIILSLKQMEEGLPITCQEVGVYSGGGMCAGN